MFLSSTIAASILLAGPPTPSATVTPDEDEPHTLDFELSGIAAMPTVSGPTVGPDLAVSFGRADLHLRVGMQILGGPDRRFTRAGHQLGEVLHAGTAHMCAAQKLRNVRIRLCGGGQLGMTHLRYHGFDQPGRGAVPWGALTGFGDLSIPLGRRSGLDPDRVGLLLQGGAMVPVLGPAVIMRAEGHRTMIRLPGSMGAIFGAGLRVGLR